MAAALTELDAVGARWRELYTEACAISDEAVSGRRRACLMLARERLDAVIAGLEAPGSDTSGLGIAELAPTIEACRN
jgi:hypothetical protein